MSRVERARVGNQPREAGTGQAGGTGRAVALKADRRPRQFTPTGTRQDFLLPISGLQAEGKVVVLTPMWVTRALLGVSLARDPPLGSQAQSPPPTEPTWGPSSTEVAKGGLGRELGLHTQFHPQHPLGESFSSTHGSISEGRGKNRFWEKKGFEYRV